MTEQDVTNDLIQDVLARAFIEIRSTENIKKARTLADVFHNVPAMIKHNRDPSDIYEKILEVARRQDCKGIIIAYFEHAKQQANRARP